VAKKSYLVGFSESDITPATPVLLAGYYRDRRSTGIHDRLYARSMAVSDGESRVAICAADLVELDRSVVAETRRLVKENAACRRLAGRAGGVHPARAGQPGAANSPRRARITGP